MKTHIIALLLLTGGVLNLFGENLHNFFNRYNFSFITEDTGLPHNFINDIYKDTQGYIWVATNNGATTKPQSVKGAFLRMLT